MSVHVCCQAFKLGTVFSLELELAELEDDESPLSESESDKASDKAGAGGATKSLSLDRPPFTVRS